MRFSDSFIDKVRESNDLVEVISEVTRLKNSSSSQFMGLCPFPDHKEKSPSFSVSQSKQLYHCFGCQKAGNIFTFLKDYHGYNFVDSIKYLARKASIELPQEQVGAPNTEYQKNKEILQRVSNWAQVYFIKNFEKLSESSELKKYLKNRGLTKETVTRFQLGFASDSWDQMVKSMTQAGVPLPQGTSLGLVKPKSKQSGYFDIFRNRLMFPIYNVSGEVIAFGGRVLGDEKPKYINSPEHLLFKKNKTLYGLNWALKGIRESQYSIVVEGYMDVIALHQAGFTQAIAPLGTAFTENHARLLKRYTKNVLVLFDGDEAGKKAAFRSLPFLLKEGFGVKSYFFAKGLDPDSFIQEKGIEAFKKEVIRGAEDLFVIYLRETAVSSGSTASEKVQWLKNASELLKVIPDPALRDLYVQMIAQRLNESPEWVYRAHNHNVKQSNSTDYKVKGQPEKAPIPTVNSEIQDKYEPSFTFRNFKPPYELDLLNLAFKEERVLKLLETELEQFKGLGGSESDEKDQKISLFENSEVMRLIVYLIEIYRQNPNKFANFYSQLVHKIKPKGVIDKHLKKPMVELSSDESVQLAFDHLKKIKRKHQDRIKGLYLNQLSSGQGSISDLKKIMELMSSKNKT